MRIGVERRASWQAKADQAEVRVVRFGRAAGVALPADIKLAEARGAVQKAVASTRG
jgi:hypothetical protein